MKFKQVIFSGIFWRGLYFVTVLLLNIVVSRYFHAKGSGWIYYITDGIYRDLRVTLKSLEDLENLRLKTINQRRKIGAGR